jgi:hypothetical protein
LKLLCANKNFICDFETQLFHREIGFKHWRTKTNDNTQLAENVVILLLTFRGICEGGDSLAQSFFGTRILKYKQNSLLKTKPPLLQSRC